MKKSELKKIIKKLIQEQNAIDGVDPIDGPIGTPGGPTIMIPCVVYCQNSWGGATNNPPTPQGPFGQANYAYTFGFGMSLNSFLESFPNAVYQQDFFQINDPMIPAQNYSNSFGTWLNNGSNYGWIADSTFVLEGEGSSMCEWFIANGPQDNIECLINSLDYDSCGEPFDGTIPDSCWEGDAPMYSCDACNGCVPDENGPFAGLDECEKSGCSEDLESFANSIGIASGVSGMTAAEQYCIKCSTNSYSPPMDEKCGCCEKIGPTELPPKDPMKDKMADPVRDRMQKLANIKPRK